MNDPTSNEQEPSARDHTRRRPKTLRFCQANAVLFLILGTVWAISTGVFLLMRGSFLVALGVSAGYLVSLGFAVTGILLHLPHWQQYSPARRNTISILLFVSILDVAAIALAIAVGG